MGEIAKIPNYIHTLRGVQVALDADLAMMYTIPTGQLNQAVKRNLERFPEDFMFQLTDKEWENLKSQSVISSLHGGRRHAPFAFTEQGVAMLSSVLQNKKAIEINIKIMRSFVAARKYFTIIGAKSKEISELREMLMLHIDHTKTKLSKHDEQLRDIAEALNAFLAEPPKPKNKIGFRTC
jgi:hypothetical protein